MASAYLIQVVHREDGRLVSWEPGRQAEKDVLTELLARIDAKWRALADGPVSDADRLTAVQAAFTELLFDLKVGSVAAR